MGRRDSSLAISCKYFCFSIESIFLSAGLLLDWSGTRDAVLNCVFLDSSPIKKSTGSKSDGGGFFFLDFVVEPMLIFK